MGILQQVYVGLVFECVPHDPELNQYHIIEELYDRLVTPAEGYEHSPERHLWIPNVGDFGVCLSAYDATTFLYRPLDSFDDMYMAFLEEFLQEREILFRYYKEVNIVSALLVDWC